MKLILLGMCMALAGNCMLIALILHEAFKLF